MKPAACHCCPKEEVHSASNFRTAFKMDQSNSVDARSGSPPHSRRFRSRSRSPVKLPSRRSASPVDRRGREDFSSRRERRSASRSYSRSPSRSRSPGRRRTRSYSQNSYSSSGSVPGSPSADSHHDKEGSGGAPATVHISGLTRSVTSEHVAEIVGYFATVIESQVMVDSTTGLSRVSPFVQSAALTAPATHAHVHRALPMSKWLLGPKQRQFSGI